MAEGARLESVFRGNSNVGSNPTLSAILESTTYRSPPILGVASKGVRLGNWLSIRQAETLLNTPDATTITGLRDRAILAVLLGCGLRRSEVAALTMGHVQQRDGRWCVVDLVGKHGRVRTIPMPPRYSGGIRPQADRSTR